MRRIVIFTPSRYERGGSARRSRLLCAALAERGWDVRVVSKADPLRWFVVHRTGNVTVLEVPGFRSRLVGSVLFLGVGIPVGIVWGLRASIFLGVQLASPALAAAVCGTMLRRPFAAMATTSGTFSEAAYIMASRSAPLRRHLLGRAEFLVAQTQQASKELTPLVGRDRVVVIPNPVEPVDAPPLNGVPRVVYTGRLSAEKDLLRLLDAWRAIVDELPTARLTLVGDGGFYRPVEEELRAAVAADPVLTRTVRFTGWIPDVSPYLAACDVYVLPSLTEGMSNSLLEACAWGKVVVASDIASNRAVLGEDYPLLFSAGDTGSLLGALRQALTDEAVRTASRHAVQARVREFSVDAVLGQLEQRISAAADRGRH